MNINLRLKDLQRMRDYLYPSEVNYMLNAIISYAEDGTEYEFSKDRELMIWEDVKQTLDASKASYRKWCLEQKKKNAERDRVKGTYIGRIEDLEHKEENLPF